MDLTDHVRASFRETNQIGVAIVASWGMGWSCVPSKWDLKKAPLAALVTLVACRVLGGPDTPVKDTA